MTDDPRSLTPGRRRGPIVRCLLIAAALVGLIVGGALWGPGLWKRHKEADWMALRHASEARNWRSLVQSASGDDAQIPIARRNVGSALMVVTGSENIDVSRGYYYNWSLGHNTPGGEGTRKPEFYAELMSVGRERIAYHEEMSRRWEW